MWIKFRNFLVEFAFLFVSFIINGLVLAPLWFYLSGIYGEAVGETGGIASGYGIGGIIMSIMGPILGFGLNELFLRLKGKKTAEYYEVNYLNVDIWWGYDIQVSAYVSTEEEKTLTLWGILARILAFVAFPLRVVAFVVSYIALFCPVIYSTFGTVDPDMPQIFGSKLTHVLFDFVIVPVGGYASRNTSPRCILWVAIYLVGGLVFAAGGVLAALYALTKAPVVVVILLLLIGFFFTLSALVLTVKYSIVICLNFHTKVAVIYMLRIMMLPTILTALSLIVYFLPWANWGF